MKEFISKQALKAALGLIVLLFSGFINHPLKMSTTKILLKDEQLNFQVRMFADDVSSGMSQYVKKAFPLGTEAVTGEQKRALEKYVIENFRVKVNSLFIKFKCKDIRTDFSNPDMPVVIIEGSANGSFKVNQVLKMAIKNTLLFAYAPEQKNVVNISKGGDDKTMVFYNEQDMNYQNIEF